MYDAVMDRITRWVPELKDYFDRAAATAKVKHKPAVSLEECAAADKQQHEEPRASAKVSRRSTSASPSSARKCPSHALCRGCEIDGVHVECSFSTRVPGGKAKPGYPNTRCMLCSETHLKMLGKRTIGVINCRLRAYGAWRAEHPAVYDAVMDRITRWVPELKDQLEGYNPRLCRGCDIDGVHVE